MNLTDIPPDSLIYITPEVSSLTNFALDFWRLSKRVNKLKKQVDQETYKPVEYSLNSCARSLVELGVEIKEFAKIEYKSSLNLDVVTYESDPKLLGEAVVKETIEPAIFYKSHLIKKAKVVVATPV